jgi:hypothetical protein
MKGWLINLLHSSVAPVVNLSHAHSRYIRAIPSPVRCHTTDVLHALIWQCDHQLMAPLGDVFWCLFDGSSKRALFKTIMPNIEAIGYARNSESLSQNSESRVQLWKCTNSTSWDLRNGYTWLFLTLVVVRIGKVRERL